MRANYSKLLVQLALLTGATSMSLLMTLPSIAKEVLNQRTDLQISSIQVNTQSPVLNKLIIQNESAITNSRPTIFNELPYNRNTILSSTDPVVIPSTKPTTVVPTIPGNQNPGTITPKKPLPKATEASKKLVAVLQANKSLTILNKALKAAGLIGILQKEGFLTILAPTDEAFKKLPKDALEDLLKPENKEVLVKILTYHLVRGKVLAKDFQSGDTTSYEGGAISVKVDEKGNIMVNDADIIQKDIPANNGVIHLINAVILPPSL